MTIRDRIGSYLHVHSDYYEHTEQFIIEVFRDNKIAKSVSLLGKDTGDSKKLDELEKFEFEYCDEIKLYSVQTEDLIKISGNVIDHIQDYSGGLSSDAMNNSRLEITPNGIKQVYNEDPKIKSESGLYDGFKTNIYLTKLKELELNIKV